MRLVLLAARHTCSSQSLTCLQHRHGKQGVLNTASNSQLENEFGTKNEDDVVKQILEKGEFQSSTVRVHPAVSPDSCG